MAIELDTFFLTAPFATDDLKAHVEVLKEQLHDLEGQYANAHAEYVNVMADLQKMEEKVNFARNQLEKNMAIFDPPQPDDIEKAFDALEQGALNPLSDFSLYSGAAGTLVWAIGAGGKALKLRKLAKFQNLSKAAKAGKTARWAKVAKLGKASVYLSGVVFLVEAGLRMRSASEINAHFKQKAGEIKKQIAGAEAEVADIRAVVGEARTMRDAILADSGFATIEDYVRGLNESIAELGRQRGSLGSARRMLMSGMPVDDVEMFVPGLPAEAITALARKLAIEKALLQGRSVDEAATLGGATPVQVKGVARVQAARMALLDGQTVEQVVETTGLSQGVVEGEDEILDADMRLAWSMLEKNTPPADIAQRCLFSEDMLRAFEQEHDAKEQLFAETPVDQVADRFAVDTGQVTRWQTELSTALDSARVLLERGGPVPRLPEIAADLRIPLTTLKSLAG